MHWLDQVDLLKVHDTAISVGLHDKRALLLGGLPINYVAQLPDQADPSSQLLSDLQSMNKSTLIAGGVIPLESWLLNAGYHSAIYPDARRCFEIEADKVAKKGHFDSEGSGSTAEPLVSPLDFKLVNEREIFRNDLLPIGFLAAAQKVASSVARLIVPRFDNGQPKFRLSGERVRYLGTGWLLDQSHIMTNHHVMNARDSLEADASESDLQLQGQNTLVQFDFDSEDADMNEQTVTKLVHSNKQLDYAILELTEVTKRSSLTLWQNEVTLPSNQVIPVNIVQHPGGASKQIGMRNNLAARITDLDLAYFTDTKGGSSGSPVCNDQWQVIALHKASTRMFGALEFQGKTTEWVNIGTRIDRIIEDLKSNHGALWSSIGER